MFWGYFSHFLCFGGVSVIFWVLSGFWTFLLSFQGHFGHLSDLQGYFILIQVIEGFWLVLDTRGTPVIFDALGGAQVIFYVFGVFQSFIRFRGYIGLFLGIGVFLLFFDVLEGTLFFFQVQGSIGHLIINKSLHKYKCLWGVGTSAVVQISRREFHTHIHLNQVRVEFYLVKKKKNYEKTKN